MHRLNGIGRKGGRDFGVSFGILCIMAIAVLAAPSVGAQEQQEQRGTVETTITSGLHSFFPGQTAVLSLVDVAERQVEPSRVKVLFLDKQNRVVASERGVLAPGRALEVELDYSSLQSGELRTPVRVRIQITTPFVGDVTASRPVATLERGDFDQFAIETIWSCSSPGVGRNVEADCSGGGGLIQTITIVQ